MAINSVTFSGNVAADPRKFGDAENPDLSFSLAVTTVKKTESGYEDQPMYLQCSLFGNRARTLAEIVKKGMPLTVQGRLMPDNYEKDGQQHYSYQVAVLEVQLPPKGADNTGTKGANW
jgi:single-strand DNA-binding protein